MKAKHTPGPWEPRKGNSRDMIAIDSAEFAVAYVVRKERFGSEGPANARLIAAAPETLAELKEADATICELCKRLNPQHSDCTSCTDRDSRLRIIAKAEGGE